MPARAPRLIRPLLVLLATGVLAGCGASETDERQFIAQSRAEALERTLERVETDIADGKCNAAQRSAGRLRSQVADLPESYDGALVTNLTQWVDHLDQRIPEDCGEKEEEKEPEEEETPSPTPTPDETATPEPEATPEATPTPQATPTATPVPTQPPASPVEPPDEGGVEGPEEDGVSP